MPSTVHDQTHQVIKRTKKDEKLRIGSSGKMQATSGRAGRETMAATFDREAEDELGMLDE